MNKEGTELARFDEEVTMPKTSKTLLVNEIDGMTFSVSLKKKPREPIWKQNQPLAGDKTLEVLQKYTKAAGKKYEVHRYPKLIAQRSNVYRYLD